MKFDLCANFHTVLIQQYFIAAILIQFQGKLILFLVVYAIIIRIIIVIIVRFMYLNRKQFPVNWPRQINNHQKMPTKYKHFVHHETNVDKC